RMTAEEGRPHGFVNRIVPTDKLMATARELAGQIVSAAPLAVAALLEVTREVEGRSDRQAFDKLYSGLPARDRIRASEDYKE
ncbi:enoyl-CoA hydratase-related protein, partial [Acinetobacter baumannii]